MKSEDIIVLLNRLIARYKYLSSFGKENGIAFEFTQAERDQIDSWLVDCAHPLAYSPRVQENRIRQYAKELIDGGQ